jgi:hypothetical protein
MLKKLQAMRKESHGLDSKIGKKVEYIKRLENNLD